LRLLISRIPIAQSACPLLYVFKLKAQNCISSSLDRVCSDRKQPKSALKLTSKDACSERECCSHNFIHKQQRSSPPANSDQGRTKAFPNCHDVEQDTSAHRKQLCYCSSGASVACLSSIHILQVCTCSNPTRSIPSNSFCPVTQRCNDMVDLPTDARRCLLVPAA